MNMTEDLQSGHRWIGRLLSVSLRVIWLVGGLAILFLWNDYSPQWAVMLLPLYFLVWIAAIPLGHILIEWAAADTIGKVITSEEKVRKTVRNFSSRPYRLCKTNGLYGSLQPQLLLEYYEER